MHEGLTAGQRSLKATLDTTYYDPLETGYALTETIAKELAECVEKHDPIFDEDEYCVVRLLVGDPLIRNVMRVKYYAYLYLPSPRPNQSVFLWNKRWQRFTKRLWTLPNAWTMAKLSAQLSVPKEYQEMKRWCDAFYGLRFWPYIRKQHKIKMLSETEYLKANREELIKAGCKEGKPTAADAFDFSKIATNQIIHPKIASLDQGIFQGPGQAQHLYGNICTHKT